MTTAPDLVLSGGPVWTGDPLQPWCTAIAVTRGIITAVGGDDDVRELAGPGTELVDLAGRFLQPGFQDAHVHPVSAGLAMRSCDLSALCDAQAHLTAIAAYADQHRELSWVLGGGWSFPDFDGLPRREQLDAVVPDRPAYLQVSDGHSAWVNSRALELAGVDERTPDPPGGRIERDGQGRPTGVLHEQAMALVGDLAPDPTAADKLVALELAQAHLHGLGITAWQDAIIGAEANGLRLTEVRVNVGDVVRKGQVLATFAADTAQADVAQARANLMEAEANAADAANNAERARTSSLREHGAGDAAMRVNREGSIGHERA